MDVSDARWIDVRCEIAHTMRGKVGIDGDEMPRCERPAKPDEVWMKKWLTARKVQQPGFPSRIEEFQVLFRGDASDKWVFGGCAGKAVGAVVIAEQVERPIGFDVERHVMKASLYLSRAQQDLASGS
jgi:hypothetical protein